jgi:hypothetical protein
MKYTEWITYKGKTFLFVNAAQRSEAEYLEALREYSAEWLARPGFPILMDFTGANLTPTASQVAKEINQQHTRLRAEKHIPNRPVVIVGVSPLIRTVTYFITRSEKIHYVDDLESAKEWLFKNS